MTVVTPADWASFLKGSIPDGSLWQLEGEFNFLRTPTITTNLPPLNGREWKTPITFELSKATIVDGYWGGLKGVNFVADNKQVERVNLRSTGGENSALRLDKCERIKLQNLRVEGPGASTTAKAGYGIRFNVGREIAVLDSRFKGLTGGLTTSDVDTAEFSRLTMSQISMDGINNAWLRNFLVKSCGFTDFVQLGETHNDAFQCNNATVALPMSTAGVIEDCASIGIMQGFFGQLMNSIIRNTRAQGGFAYGIGFNGPGNTYEDCRTSTFHWMKAKADGTLVGANQCRIVPHADSKFVGDNISEAYGGKPRIVFSTRTASTPDTSAADIQRLTGELQTAEAKIVEVEASAADLTAKLQSHAGLLNAAGLVSEEYRKLVPA